MLFPKLNALPVSRRVIDTFRGYRHSLRIGAGEFYDMQNLTGDHYPVLSPRGPRRMDPSRNPAVWDAASLPQGMAAQDGLCYVSNGLLYYGFQDGAYQTADLSLTAGEKQLIPFGSYLLILPDKKYFNTKRPSDCGSIEAEFSLTVSHTADVTYTLCDKDGAAYAAVRSDTAPNAPADGQYWLDTANYLSDNIAVLKQYSAALSSWNIISPTYVKIETPGIGAPFSVGDFVCIDGEDVRPIRCLRGITEASHEIVAKENGYIVVCYPIAETSWEIPNTESFSVSRKMPMTDFLFEHENRLWGCRYGKANNGEFVNEIYASKLGDFKNWNSFQGISTDSYIASCGTDGKWTGAIKALGYPLFFKENCLHKVYGSYPAEYQMQTIPCRGVQEGCENSLAVVNEVLFYKSRGGVCAYDGSLPSCVSEALGNERYGKAVAGGCGNKYYISMQDTGGAWSLFCFDTQKGFWHREDPLRVDAFCTVGDELFYIEHDAPWIRTMPNGKGEPLEERVPWYAETGILGADAPDHKYLSRITVRLSMAVGTSVRFFAEYDSCGSRELLASVTGNRLNSVSVSLRPRRCDHLRLRIEGEGEAKIFSVTMTTERGSDLR